MKIAITAIAVLTIAACAKSPDSIAPVSMGNSFSELSCQSASTYLSAERRTLAELEDKQRGAATGDAIGVFMIGLPVSSMTGGDVEGDIATSKGKILSLEARLASC